MKPTNPMIPRQADRAPMGDMPFENNDEDPEGDMAGQIAETSALIERLKASGEWDEEEPTGKLSEIDLTKAEGPPKKGALET